MSKLKRMLSGRTALALGAWVAYVLAFIPLYRLVGQIVAALAVLPVVVTGWLFGMRAGVLTGLLTFPLNMLLTALATGTAWEMMAPGGLFGSVLILLIGVVVGRLHDLGEQVKWELAERKQAEEALKEHSERLEEMVEERTAELKTINEQLRLEITERKRAEEVLRESEEKYRTILENIEDGYYEVDLVGNLTFFNDSLCKLYEYPEDELMGMNYQQYMDDETAKVVHRTFNEVYRTGNPAKAFDWEVSRKDGARRFVAASVTRITDAAGEPVGFRGIVRDITERKRAEEELKRRNRELATLYEAATAISSDLSLDAVLQAVAEQITQALGSSGCALSLWQQDGNLIVTLVDYDKDYPDKTEPPGTTYCLSDYPVTRRVLETGRPMVIRRDDPTADQTELALMEEQEVPVLLMLPLIARDRVLGLIELTDYVEARQYTPEQIRLAQSIAAQAAIAIENAQLYEEIEERRMYLEGVLRAAPDAIVALDARHRIMEWNLGAQKLFGYLQEEVVGRDIDDLITRPDVFEEAVGFTQMVTGGEEIPPVETVRYRKDGSPVDIIVAGSPILVGNELIGVVGVYTDITEQKRAEEALQQREAVLEAIALAAEKFLRPSDWEQDIRAALAYLGKAADVSRASIWEASTSDDGKYLISGCYEWLASEAKLAPLQGLQNVPVFRRWRDLLPRGEIITGHVRDFSAKEQEFFVPREIKSVLAVPIFVNGVWWGFMGFDQGGTERKWTEAEMDALKTAASIFGGALERKRTEEALRDEKALMDALMDNITDSIYFKDRQCRLMRINRKMMRDLNLDEMSQAIGKTDVDLFGEEFGQRTLAEDQRIMATGEPIMGLIESRQLKDGQSNWTLTTKVPLRDASGQIMGLAGITREINELMKAEQSLRESKERLQRYAAKLEQANEEVKRFAYIVSHDLRAPLVNLKGFSTELRFALETVDSAMDTALSHLDEKQRQDVTLALEEDIPEALGFIDSSVIQMDRFISALLKLSRLGRRELHLESVDIEALVQEVLETLAHQIEERQVRVTVEPLPEVVADRTSMEQIMGNILTNAIKYLAPDRPGEIKITAERSDEETTFRIRDNGRGIAEEDMSKVFVPFRRVGRQDVPGEGMGLAYVQALVRRHGGRIWCESELGAGTTFSFTISNYLEKGGSYA